MSTAFSGQMTAITGAIERAASAAQERHESSCQQLLLETGRITSGQAEFRQHFDDSITVVIDDVAGVLGATQAVLREVGELRKSIADLRGECIDPINGRIESQATAFRESVSQLEQSMRQGFDDLTERLTVTRTTAAVAAIAAIAAAVIAFVR